MGWEHRGEEREEEHGIVASEESWFFSGGKSSGQLLWY